MNQRMMMMVAAALTAFVLMLGGGLGIRMLGSLAAPAPTSSASPQPELAIVEPTMAPALDPAVESLIRQREQSYQQALVEANARLEEANARIAEANRQIESANSEITRRPAQGAAQPVANPAPLAQPAPVAAVAAPAEAPTDPPPTYAIGAAQAQEIALATAPGTMLARQPELVLFQGIAAYEVVLDRGTMYIDAQTGQVLHNGVPAVVASGPSGEHEDDDDHGHDGDDDHGHDGGEHEGGDDDE